MLPSFPRVPWHPPTSPVSLALFPLQVWDLSDIDKDGHLDRDEFAVVGPCCDSLFYSAEEGNSSCGVSGFFFFPLSDLFTHLFI